MLNIADARGREITNLALQKLLYFAHGTHLTEARTPLVTGYFEAWQFGPVHPAAYRAFKSAGACPIRLRAVSQNPLTLEATDISLPSDPEHRALAERVINTHARSTPGRLVEISHAVGGPWDFIVKKGSNSATFGHRIPNDVIAALFQRHKVSIGLEPRHGEPGEDRPFTAYRSGARRDA